MVSRFTTWEQEKVTLQKYVTRNQRGVVIFLWWFFNKCYKTLLFYFEGVSVLEMVHAFEEASGVKIPVEMAGRRAGDVASSYATCDLAEKEMGFKCKYTLFDMCKCPDKHLSV